jgi:hypothetical protein
MIKLASSHPPVFRVEVKNASALLSALTKLSEAAVPGTLSRDEAFAIAALKYLTAGTLIAARSSERACTV